MGNRPPWSGRRRRTIAALAAGAGVGGLGALVLPDEYGITSGFLGALCGFLLIVAVIVFVAVPGPGTLDTLLRATPLAGASLVVAVLLLLSAPAELRPLWWTGVAAAATWTAGALWAARRADD